MIKQILLCLAVNLLPGKCSRYIIKDIRNNSYGCPHGTIARGYATMQVQFQAFNIIIKNARNN